MKTFEDLVFLEDLNEWLPWNGSKKAIMKFANGYSVVVGIGMNFHSNNVDEYEVQIYKGGERCKGIVHWTDLQYCTEKEVSKIMIKVQEL